MTVLDWIIVVIVFTFVVGIAIITNKYTLSVADFLSASRCAKRYLLCVADGMSALGAISVIAFFELYYSAGFTAAWWHMIVSPVIIIMAMSGWIIYRFRETRALTLAQFIEIRYSKKLRIFAGMLAWCAGVINFGIFPAVGARFFIHFCNLPAAIPFLGISTFAFIMFSLLAISILFVFLGGQVTLIVTDFIQGIFTNLIFLIIILVFFWKFDWQVIIDTLKAAPAGESMLDPFDTSKIKDFNFMYFFIGVFATVYTYMSWQGNQAYNCSAKSPHEAKMAKILGSWRALLLGVLVMMLPVGAYVIMHNADYVSIADEVRGGLERIENKTIYNQMIVPMVLAKILPIGVIGLLCAMMVMAFIASHDTYLHSWGSIFVQDVILPVKKKPFTTKQHLLVLRLSILLVGIIIFLFSLLFQQNQYIFMFFSITAAIYSGGAGSVIIGGLYWKKGTTLGAWAALLIGCAISIGGLILRQTWQPSLYPWLSENAPSFLNSLKYLLEGIANKVPGINWEVGPAECPLNGQWFYFLAIISAITGYIAFSLISRYFTKEPYFDLDKMLHRGAYAIQGEHSKIADKPPVGFRALLPSNEFSKVDKIIYYATLLWTMGWFVVFLTGLILNFMYDISDEVWGGYWKWYVFINVILGIICISWFLIGGLGNLKELFHTLKMLQRDAKDNGRV